MRKTNVAVVFGGKSPERKVSISTGINVAKNLNKRKYNVFPIEIGADGIHWNYESIITTDYSKLLKKLKIDIVFLALHGPNGEDGTVQGVLEILGIPYTGSGVLASALGMDKLYSRHIFEKSGLSIPKYVSGTKNGKVNTKDLDWPLFVQPNNQGSAIGASVAKNVKELNESLQLARQYCEIVLIDEFIKGTELTCAILGNEDPIALPLIEIISKHEFFDYQAKYDPALVDEICPARISGPLSLKVQAAAIKAYKAIGCKAFGRVDIIIKGTKIYILEINTIPGLTPVSLFPKAAKVAGISYLELLDKIIHYSNP